MTAPKISRTVTVKNPQGLHARPAELFVKAALRFEATIEIVKGHERVDGKSILSILTLAATEGTELVLEVCGPDAQHALDELAALVESGFDELENSE